MPNIGSNIATRRKELHMTQEELAKKMGYKSRSTINKIELGINDIPQAKIIRFSEVLDVSIAYLMGWEGQEEKSAAEDGLTAKKIELLNFVKCVPDDKAALALRLLKSVVEDD